MMGGFKRRSRHGWFLAYRRQALLSRSRQSSLTYPKEFRDDEIRSEDNIS